MTFDGFPREAFDLYAGLEDDNSREYWHAHKQVYDDAVRGPMEALADQLGSAFGEPKIWRPQRDVRFSHDKSPYKTYQGLTFGSADSIGYYLQLGAEGVRLGGGFHGLTSQHVQRYRAAVDDGRSGAALQRIVADLETDGWAIVGEQLKTRPRGTAADHPRLELLRYTSVGAERLLSRSAAGRPGFADEVRARWKDLRPLVDWAGRHVSGEE